MDRPGRGGGARASTAGSTSPASRSPAPVAANWAGLERAHGYQSLIRTELARNPGVAEQWICGPELLARCPDLLAVCSAGAGYDIVDVDACTAAGVIVCNNSGPGREAVAEHALGFMLTLAKKICSPTA